VDIKRKELLPLFLAPFMAFKYADIISQKNKSRRISVNLWTTYGRNGAVKVSLKC
jgi:hypothetical protein